MGTVKAMKATLSQKPLPTTMENRKILVAMLVWATTLGLTTRGGEIHDAVKTGDVKTVRQLLEHERSLANDADERINYPLHFAASRGDKEMVQLLLAYGASRDAWARDFSVGTALHVATSKGFKSVAEALLANGANPDAKEIKWRTPLHLAASNGYEEVVEILLAFKANPNIKAAEDIGMPIHEAIRADKPRVVEILLNKGADVNAGNWNRKTPLHLAGELGNNAIVELLLAKNADVNARTHVPWTPLDAARIKNRADTAALLVQHGGISIYEQARNLSGAVKAGDTRKAAQIL